MQSSAPNVLRYGLPATWGSLIPALQHTALADSLLGNVFEPLVRYRLGVIELAAALSWSVSGDKTTYVFQIDTSRRFSNGEPLSANHFKRAWEYALRLPAMSANPSLNDVLYRVKGFAEFRECGVLSGVRTLGEDHLQIEFNGPYRTALEDLAGNRYSAAVYEGESVLGTGPYALASQGPETATFHKNPFAQHANTFDKVVVTVVPLEDAEDSLRLGRIDAYDYFGRGDFPVHANDAHIKCVCGPDAGHEVIRINGLKGRFFESRKRRRALQALVWRILQGEDTTLFQRKALLRRDPQFYLPFQAGRLPQEEVDLTSDVGPEDITKLISDSQKEPLYVTTRSPDRSLIDALRNAGLGMDTRSGQVSFKEAMEDYYKLFAFDLSIGGFGVGNGDPDGAYHLLGKSGAIASPTMLREGVSRLLEEGRGVIETEKLHEHYKKVSSAILSEVPFVHLGINSGRIAFRTDKVDADETMLARAGGRFHSFRRK